MLSYPWSCCCFKMSSRPERQMLAMVSTSGFSIGSSSIYRAQHKQKRKEELGGRGTWRKGEGEIFRKKCFKNKSKLKLLAVVKGLRQPDIMTHGFNPSTWRAEAGRSLFVSGDSRLYSETLFQKEKKNLESKNQSISKWRSVYKDRAVFPAQSTAYPLRKNTLRARQGTQSWHGH